MLSRHYKLAVLGFLAMGVWYATVWHGQVWAGWSPPRPTLQFGFFRVAPFGEPVDPEDPEPQMHSRQIAVSSAVPECLTPTVTVTWVGSEDELVEDGSSLRWSSAEKTRNFTISTDCTLAVHLFAIYESQSQLVWGAARVSNQSALAQGSEHKIPLSQETTEVRWFVPSSDKSFTLALLPGVVTHDAAQMSRSPLLAQWWQGGFVQPCHESANIFFRDVWCSDGWWQTPPATNLPPSSHISLPQPGTVIISEVNWAGSYRNGESLSTDEWIEFTNLTPESFALQGTRLHGARSAGLVLIIDAPVVIPPYGVAVIGRLSAEQSQIKNRAHWITTQLSLSNTEAQIILQLPDGTELDRTPSGSWQSGKNVTGTQPLRASAQRHLYTVGQGANWSSWFDCTELQESFCHTLSGRVWKSSTTTTIGTPGLISP